LFADRFPIVKPTTKPHHQGEVPAQQKVSNQSGQKLIAGKANLPARFQATRTKKGCMNRENRPFSLEALRRGWKSQDRAISRSPEANVAGGNPQKTAKLESGLKQSGLQQST